LVSQDKCILAGNGNLVDGVEYGEHASFAEARLVSLHPIVLDRDTVVVFGLLY